jgi:hypothetical protein
VALALYALHSVRVGRAYSPLEWLGCRHAPGHRDWRDRMTDAGDTCPGGTSACSATSVAWTWSSSAAALLRLAGQAESPADRSRPDCGPACLRAALAGAVRHLLSLDDAGRPDPPVPDGVQVWHPLNDPRIIWVLPPSKYEQDLKRLARQEL